MSKPMLRLCALALSATLLPAAALHAGEPGSGARKPPSKVTFHKSASEEKPAERAQRLKRECKGRPNAGMCAGFAS